MNVAAVSTIPEADARAAFLLCCGSRRWVDAMITRRPFASADDLYRAAAEAEATLDRVDWLEAFAAHPRIGDLETLRTKFGTTVHEQAGVAEAGEEVLRALADGNRQYEAKFGYIFIVCATGKSAAEMLAVLRRRLANDPKTELEIAAAEQASITRLRLEKL